MEEDEMEMTEEELRRWIRRKVKRSELLTNAMVEKCSRMHSLVQRREHQAAQLLKLSKAVAACEAIVRKQYSLLGWEYTDTDRNPNGHTPLAPKLDGSEKLYTFKGKQVSVNLQRQPVVVLRRVSLSTIRSFRQPLRQYQSSSDESGSEWDPNGDSDDSDSSFSSYNTGPNKRRKMDPKNENPASPQASANAAAKCNLAKTETPPANTEVTGSICKSSDKDTKTQDSCSMPEEEIKVNMNVLAAKSRAIGWQQGEIMEIVTKKHGRCKYKINFDDKEKRLVSGHHMAFASMPNAKQLFVGARVVAKCQTVEPSFCSGILAELPCRKNHMRFLVFLDDHTPVYVALPFLHLVCKPLEDPLDDIKDDTHRNFMREYLKHWPYPHQTKYNVGQTLHAELNGVQEKCKVKLLDCSLIQVVFEKQQCKEWIYRGSIRLEQMINMRENLGLKREQEQKDKSTRVDESSKTAQ